MHNPVLTPQSHTGSDHRVNTQPRQSALQKLTGHPNFKLWLLVILGLVTMVLLVLLVDKVTMKYPQTIEIGQPQVGSTIALKSGDHLQVKLAGNPTAGYTWEVASLDPGILKLSGDSELKANSTSPGAGGNITLSFDTVGTGTTRLKLIYHRPFENNVAPLKTYEVTVTVK